MTPHRDPNSHKEVSPKNSLAFLEIERLEREALITLGDLCPAMQRQEVPEVPGLVNIHGRAQRLSQPGEVDRGGNLIRQ